MTTKETGVVVYNKADPFDYMVNYTDTLISADLENLYQSINNGYTWTSLNNTFKGSFINQMVVNKNLLYLCVSLKGLQVSLDKGQHFYSLNGDIPASKYIRRVAFDSAYIYVLTTNGIYRRANNVDQSVGGVSSFQNAESLHWYPNPTESLVTLPLSNIQSVEVYNLVGQKMNVPANIQILQALLDMSNLPSGVYQVRLLTPHGQSVSKVIKL